VLAVWSMAVLDDFGSVRFSRRVTSRTIVNRDWPVALHGRHQEFLAALLTTHAVTDVDPADAQDRRAIRASNEDSVGWHSYMCGCVGRLFFDADCGGAGRRVAGDDRFGLTHGFETPKGRLSRAVNGTNRIVSVVRDERSAPKLIEDSCAAEGSP
jgi:hypothetical protein